MDKKEPETQAADLSAYRDAVTGNGEVDATAEMLGTTDDQRDMFRMGKVQRFRVKSPIFWGSNRSQMS